MEIHIARIRLHGRAMSSSLPRCGNATVDLIGAKYRTLAAAYTDLEQAAELDRLAGLPAIDRGDTAQAEQLLRSAADGYAAARALVEKPSAS